MGRADTHDNRLLSVWMVFFCVSLLCFLRSSLWYDHVLGFFFVMFVIFHCVVLCVWPMLHVIVSFRLSHPKA